MPQLLRSNSTVSKEEVGNTGSIVSDLALVGPEGRVGFRGLFGNKFILGISLFSTLGGFVSFFLTVHQGVLSGVLTTESFGATFPDIYVNQKLKGWFVSTFVLGKSTWHVASVCHGPVCDKIGRKICIICNAVIFLLGGSLQAGAISILYLFAGRAVAGLAIGSLTHVVPMYLAEISSANIRGTLVSLQQLAITFGVSETTNWIAYGTSHIRGTQCAPKIPYTEVLPNGMLASNPHTDVPPGGCAGQTQASWRVPLAFQILPALCLAIGMLFMPYSPRWLVEQGREVEALETLSRLRRKPTEDCSVRTEFLEIMAEARFARETMKAAYPNAGPVRRIINKYTVLMSSWPKSKRIFVGCLIMTFQQNMVGFQRPLSSTVFGQLGLDPNTTSLIATGVYGIVNMLATLPAIALVDSVGRRPVLISGAAGCLICLAIVSIIITVYGKDWPAHAAAARIAIVFVFLYDVIFSYSWAPMGWVVTSEIFPLHLRSTGTSITTSTMWLSNIAIGLFAQTTMGPSVSGIVYYVYAVFCLAALLSAIFIIPETKGRTLEEMDPVFRDNATDSQREHKEGIRRELGLPDRALLSAA
ncbi:general substrate transporter [Suillus subaureus]|uniref:General substrate transporter n=1 Tax=Suillus subaureus TaxID=48587 RepID=A0A9P7E6A5_9AGAM|nr:general substrate transporter [Suillus subaureus]KAG1812055.1 general substrate transporter [Suillus subaureus]